MDSRDIISALLDMAARVENAAAKFYQQASQFVTDDETRKEFQRLTAMELQHEKFFSDLKLKYVSQPATTVEKSTWHSIVKYGKAMQDYRVFDFDFILNHTLKGQEKFPDIIQLAIGFEKDSIVFYAGLANMNDNESLSKLLKEIMQQEFDHLSMLTNIAFF